MYIASRLEEGKKTLLYRLKLNLNLRQYPICLIIFDKSWLGNAITDITTHYVSWCQGQKFFMFSPLSEQAGG